MSVDTTNKLKLEEPAETEPVNMPPETAATDLSTAQPGRPTPTVQYFNVRDHGYTNGLLGVEGEVYEAFIRHHEAVEHLEAQLDRIVISQKMLTEKRNQLLRSEDEARSSVFARKTAVKGTVALADTAREKVQAIRQKIEVQMSEHQSTLDKHRSDYTLFSGILFLTFALLFMGADIGISYSVIAKNLMMDGWDGILLSIGIGGLSIAFKPLYDRVAEKRLHTKDSTLPGKKGWFIFFTIVTLVAILACIATFAYLRTVILDQMNAPTDVPVFMGEDPVATAQSTAPAEVSFWTAWYTQIGMVAAGIVFILGGTICMSIAVPVLFRNWKAARHKRWLRKRERELTDTLTAAQPLIIAADKAVGEAEEAEDTLQDIRRKLEDLESAADLEEKRTDFLKQLAAARAERSLAAYKDAFERGTARRALFSEMEKLSIANQQSAEETAASKSYTPGRSRLRPFVAVRRMLTERMRNSSGTSFATDTNLDIQSEQ